MPPQSLGGKGRLTLENPRWRGLLSCAQDLAGRIVNSQVKSNATYILRFILVLSRKFAHETDVNPPSSITPNSHGASELPEPSLQAP